MINKQRFPTFRSRIVTLFIILSLPVIPQVKQAPYLSIPLIDLDTETFRQVVVDREEGQYLGHPTTLLLEDGITILTVYPKGHGRGEIVYKKSPDGGLTWSERITVPESWKTSLEVPTIYRVEDAEGRKRIIMFSGLYPARMAVSEDDGETWTGLEMAGNWGGIVVMSSILPLRTGKGHYMALFHDDLRYFTSGGQAEYEADKRINGQSLFTLYKTISTDGGLTWSFPQVILRRRDLNLCEPGVIRSPDGRRIAVLLRENSRSANSQIIFSADEGKTWTEPRPLPNELNGDRHVLKYVPDGRLLCVFRDRSPSGPQSGLTEPAAKRSREKVNNPEYGTGYGSPTEGDWAGWVGTWKDLVKGRPGEYRVRFKNNFHGSDCCYPGVELLPDGTFVVTTYGFWESGKQPFILSVRVKLDELDNKLKALKKEKRVN